MQSTTLLIIKLCPIILGFVILFIGTMHSIKKVGEKKGVDKFPPNAYDNSGNDDISV